MPGSTDFRDTQYAEATNTVQEIEALLELQFPVQLILANLRQIHGKLFALDNKTCTGTIHWRDKTSPTRKMMIIHRTGQACPLHGQPRTSSRVRSYIGTNSERQAEARAAIAALPVRAQLERDANRCTRLIYRTLSALRHVREQLDQLQQDLAP